MSDKTPSTPKDIIFLLDSSGSMASMGDEPLQALNAFVSSQAALNIPGSTFSLWYFSHELEKVVDDKPLDVVGEVKRYNPGGMTALFDAMGTAISTKLEKEQVRNVVCVTLTDGEENASQRYTSAGIRELVKKAEDEYNWKFVFLGANQDAFASGASVGVHTCAQFDCEEGGLEDVVRESSQAIGRFRSGSDTNEISLSSSQGTSHKRRKANTTSSTRQELVRSVSNASPSI